VSLPQATPEFIGRQEILDELDAVLASESADGFPAVVVEGMPGVGKTAVAVHWAAIMAERFPDGALFIDLRGHSSGTALTQAEALRQLLILMGVPDQQIPGDAEVRTAAYQERLAAKKVLLVLDNAQNTSQVDVLLPLPAGSLAVVTSRYRLQELAGTSFVRVRLEVLPLDDAVALLASFAGEDRISREPGAAKDLAEQCGCLPLALRIAGANLSGRPLSDIASAVRELEQGHLSALAVHDDPSIAIRRTFGLSYENLPDEQRRLFMLLGIFQGRSAAAEASAALLGATVEATQVLLTKLQFANLIEEVAPGRYRLHDLLREYARERAAAEIAEPEQRLAVRRLISWYLTTARERGRFLERHPWGSAGYPPKMRRPADPAGWHGRMAWFETERENIVAVTRQAQAIGADHLAWELADVLYDFLQLCGYTGDNMTVHQLGLAAAQQLGNTHAEVRMRQHLAVIERELGRHDAALEQTDQVIRLSRELADHRSESAALNNLARIEYSTGRYFEALSTAQAALRIRQAAGDRMGEAQTLNTLGWTQRALGRYTDALRDTLAALDIRQEMADRLGEAGTIESLARLYRVIGWYEEAAKCGQSALEKRRALGDRLGQGESLQNLARVYRRLGLYAQARNYALEALDITQEIGYRRGIADSYAALGDIQLDSAIDADALENYRAALRIREEIGDQRGTSAARQSMARLYRKGADYPQALSNAYLSMEISGRIGDRYNESRAADSLARTYLLTHDHARASDFAGRALRIREEIGDCRGEGDTVDLIARVYRAMGQYGRAMDRGRRSYQIQQHIGYRRGQAKALETIARTELAMNDLDGAIKTARHAAGIWADLGDQRSLGNILDVFETIARTGLTLNTQPERPPAGRRAAARTRPSPPASGAALRDVTKRLLRLPAIGETRLHELGLDPEDPGLLRLPRPDGSYRWPEFQFSHGDVPDVVRSINQLLGAHDDPIGVASWWLGRNGWLGEAPSRLIGQVADGLLLQAARAVTTPA
jgi:tetratricopeptide (TPR) repeat protein